MGFINNGLLLVFVIIQLLYQLNLVLVYLSITFIMSLQVKEWVTTPCVINIKACFSLLVQTNVQAQMQV